MNVDALERDDDDDDDDDASQIVCDLPTSSSKAATATGSVADRILPNVKQRKNGQSFGRI